ncbi:conserved protein of unknown function [Georgfuchsia toluolica]|uniref:Uncharacterized protein n=1 Tax=Georgfuchsia toluolica TaxID=424218 RepID=A0A916MZM0_9PROT|nr:hypothetical protein [Georgfuchsia toluolica]CAG4883073.1 conserved protein of unknown function [Georgfuchsia toluolica]
MSLEQRTSDLLNIAADYRADQCRSLFAQAAEDSRVILKATHIGARHDLRTTLAPEQERLAAEIAAAELKLVTLRRLDAQKNVKTILRQAWPRLTQALRARWDTPAGRAAWVAHHFAVALKALPAKAWMVQHPEDWPAMEREWAKQWLQAHGIEDASFAVEVKMSAGIRIVCGLNVLDASLDGLLADGAQIEGRLLHYLAVETER